MPFVSLGTSCLEADLTYLLKNSLFTLRKLVKSVVTIEKGITNCFSIYKLRYRAGRGGARSEVRHDLAPNIYLVKEIERKLIEYQKRGEPISPTELKHTSKDARRNCG